jgi:hypothetical protein
MLSLAVMVVTVCVGLTLAVNPQADAAGQTASLAFIIVMAIITRTNVCHHRIASR